MTLVLNDKTRRIQIMLVSFGKIAGVRGIGVTDAGDVARFVTVGIWVGINGCAAVKLANFKV